jgi:NAD(P)-dependent dehydrogenase (short-subunit alcohol dehydrogenase family)
MIDLTGRVALVTGGSAGIGRSIAAALHAHGARVALTSRSAERAQEAARQIAGGDSDSVIGLACDVRDPDACSSAADATVQRLGGLDILINNAGLGVFKSIREMTIEEWELQIRTNLDGVFYMTKAALPTLVDTDDAWIINIGSLAGRNTFPGGVAYNASKFGLVGMSEAMMLDLRYDGIRTAIVMPGSVNTDFSHQGEDRPWAIQPEDIAASVLHLMSQPATTLISRVEVRPSAPPRR